MEPLFSLADMFEAEEAEVTAGMMEEKKKGGEEERESDCGRKGEGFFFSSTQRRRGDARSGRVSIRGLLVGVAPGDISRNPQRQHDEDVENRSRREEMGGGDGREGGR